MNNANESEIGKNFNLVLIIINLIIAYQQL
jgi:hypothetical protein